MSDWYPPSVVFLLGATRTAADGQRKRERNCRRFGVSDQGCFVDHGVLLYILASRLDPSSPLAVHAAAV